MYQPGTCVACGTPAGPGAKFCGRCGAPVDSAAAPAAPPTVAGAAPTQVYPSAPVPASGVPYQQYPGAVASPQPYSPQPYPPGNPYQQTPAYGGPGWGYPQQPYLPPRRAGASGVAIITSVIGGGIIMTGLLLPWISGGLGNVNSFDVPVSFLFGTRTRGAGINVGVIVLLAAITGAGLAFSPSASVLRRLVALVVTPAPMLFIAQMIGLVNDLGGKPGDAFEVIGAGPYVMFVGAIVLLAAPKK